MKTIQDTYLQTGIVANKITNLLRQMGFGAQSGPGLGGQTVYPVLAEHAGLGAFGRHGLIITPENGPTHRLGVVYTNITNLPLNEKITINGFKIFVRSVVNVLKNVLQMQFIKNLKKQEEIILLLLIVINVQVILKIMVAQFV